MESKYRVNGSIWIEGKHGAFIGHGRVLLLEGIQKFGSITKAARAMKMSYRQAWELVNSMNKESRSPLVETASGGTGGGGTSLTPEGRRAIATYRKLNDEFSRFREDLTRDLKL
ncbi:MAG: LysR family transcriptional regulator [Bacteroidia bacterium]|nr:LysR family transcriptional regulator [Bacteroidia bacterium]